MQFSKEKVNAFAHNLKKKCEYKLNKYMLFLGNLLHVDVKMVAYFKHRCLL